MDYPRTVLDPTPALAKDHLPFSGFFAAVVVALLLPASAHAIDLPATRLDTIFPPGAKAGENTDVAIAGADLDEADSLLFSHPGITAEPKDKHFLVKVSADVPPGIYDVRVTGLFGVSNPRAFAIGYLPETARSKPNTRSEAAQEVGLNSVVSGTLTAAASDFYKFKAKKGGRLLIECATLELDSRLSPVLSVLDSNARELESSGRGGLLDFTPPSDGWYTVRLHDLTYGGGPSHFYRLTVTTGPHLDFIFPPSGLAGTKSKFTLYGRNLPGGVPAKLGSADGKPLDKLETEIELPAARELRGDGLVASAAASVDGFSYRLRSPSATSNPVFISFAEAPVVAEQEPNNLPAQAQKVMPPCEIAGQFYPDGDVDSYTFDAKKGEVWTLEIFSSRLGLSTQPFLLVQRETTDLQSVYGTEPLATEKRFSTATSDPVCRLEVKQDGEYRVTVRDLFGGARRAPQNVYRLSLRRESPDFRLAAVVDPPAEKPDDRTAAPRTPILRGGGTAAIKVVAIREDNFTGDIELSAEGLPPGVTCSPTKIASGKKEGVLLLTAGEKPARWVGPIRVIGTAKVGEKVLTHEARGATVRWPIADFNIDPVQVRLTRDLDLAVSADDAAPVSIEPAEEKVWEVPEGGKLDLPLKITRRGEFKEALKLKAGGAAALDALKEIDVDAKAATITASLDLAALKLPAGSHIIYFQTYTKGKFRGKDAGTAIFSPPIRLTVTPAAKTK